MTLYLDTSSLVKLYVAEADSDGVRAHVDRAAIVATATIAYPEARAALARRRRERALNPAAFAAAKRQLEADWPKYLTVQVTEALCKDAGQLAERFALRGYDSVHLPVSSKWLAKPGSRRPSSPASTIGLRARHAAPRERSPR